MKRFGLYSGGKVNEANGNLPAFIKIDMGKNIQHSTAGLVTKVHSSL